MSKPELVFGEFIDVAEGVAIAELTGQDVVRACGILATRPPYRDAVEAEALTQEDRDVAEDMALDASGVMDIALQAGKQDSEVRTAIFSKSGALAVRHPYGASIGMELYETIQMLDGGNEQILCNTHEMFLH